MKLYLSSYFLGAEPEKFAKLFTNNKRVAIIMNAADALGPAKRPDYLRKEVASLAEIGLEGEELDLRSYFNDQDGLITKVQQYDGLWVIGGNAFVLRRAMRQSGFDRIAPELVKSNHLVYGGFSAGAVVAAQTLRGIELVDDPAQVPDGYHAEVIWDGLELYDASIAPHYRSNHPESAAIEKVVGYFQDNNMPYIALNDGQAITIDT
jgi:dipeptidase E